MIHFRKTKQEKEKEKVEKNYPYFKLKNYNSDEDWETCRFHIPLWKFQDS